MSEHSTEPRTGGPAYEQSDAALRPIVAGAIALVALLMVTPVLMWVLDRELGARLARESPPASPLAESYGRHEPPAPRLQKDPRADLLALHAREQTVLDSYGWIDRAQSRVHIPVARAAELLANEAPR